MKILHTVMFHEEYTYAKIELFVSSIYECWPRPSCFSLDVKIMASSRVQNFGLGLAGLVSFNVTELYRYRIVYHFDEYNCRLNFIFKLGFWATVCKTVHPMLSGPCLSVMSVLSRL